MEEVSLTSLRQTWGQHLGLGLICRFLAFTGCMSVAVDAGGRAGKGNDEAMMVSPRSFFGIAVGKFAFVLLMGGLSVMATFLQNGYVFLMTKSGRLLVRLLTWNRIYGLP